MQDITESLIELIRLTSTSLPDWVENRLKDAQKAEQPGTSTRYAMDAITENVTLSRVKNSPICQDTGTPSFYIQYPAMWNEHDLRQKARVAVAEASRRGYLRPIAINPLGKGDAGNQGWDDYFPEVHLKLVEGSCLTIDLLLKGGGCENVSRQYSLPDLQLGAERDLEGVRRVVLDAVFQAQGQGCAPGFLGVAIGGDRASSYLAAKQALLDWPNTVNPDKSLAELEERITHEANELGIGPMGFGGKTTVLGTRIHTAARLPASFFVSSAYMCWAFRKRRMKVEDGEVIYE